MAERSDYGHGSIWVINFNPSVGTEIRKTRPGVIISGTVFNARRSKVTVLPFTTLQQNDPRLSPAVVTVKATPENGLATDSLVVCIEPMTFDKTRLIKYLGQLEIDKLQQVRLVLKQYLELR